MPPRVGVDVHQETQSVEHVDGVLDATLVDLVQHGPAILVGQRELEQRGDRARDRLAAAAYDGSGAGVSSGWSTCA